MSVASFHKSGRAMAAAGLLAGLYAAAGIAAQLLGNANLGSPDAVLPKFTASALVVAAAAALACAVLSRKSLAGGLAWTVLALLLAVQAGAESLFLRRSLEDAGWLDIAVWAATCAVLVMAVRIEGISRLLRYLAYFAIAIQALAALSDAGDGSPGLAALAPLTFAWTAEVLDVIYAPSMALALLCVAAGLALARLAGAPAPTLTAPPGHRRWMAEGFHACDVTGQGAAATLDWSFVDAAYCVSLREREDRTVAASAAFNAVGLAPRLVFYRPRRHATSPVIGIWQSHCEVARHALAAGHRRVAIFEDDVCFDRHLSASRLHRVAEALESLPPDWQVFFLGHWPVRCRFVSRHLLHTRSGCTHAYIASRRLLEWMATSDYHDFRRRHPVASVVGTGIDDAFFRLPRAYAIFPMLAIQSTSPSDHIRHHKRGKVTRLRHIVTHTRLREWALSRLMRGNEAKAAASAALAWLATRAWRPGRAAAQW